MENRKSMFFILCISILFFKGTISCAASPGDHGRCGEHAVWYLGEQGAVTITGTGKITRSYPQEDDSYPFPSVYDIQTIEIGEGITQLDTGFFKNCIRLKQIVLPESLEKIGSKAFVRCRKLKTIRIPKGVTEVDSALFYENFALRKIINHSSAAVLTTPVQTRSADVDKALPGLIWKVDGKKTDTILPGKTGIAVPRTYKITYHLHGGTLKGKKPVSYLYGSNSITLPKAEKKGYIFTGWYRKETGCLYGNMKKISGIQKNLSLYADFKRISVKRRTDGVIQIKMTAKARMHGYRIWLTYASNRQMKGGRLFRTKAAGTYGNLTYRTGKTFDTILLKKQPKKQSCYLEFCFFDERKASVEESEEEGDYFGEPVFYKTRVG